MGNRLDKSKIGDSMRGRVVLAGVIFIPLIFVCFVLAAAALRGTALTGQLFFGDTHDVFMDFYNCLKSAADRDPYNEINMVQYPPLCELIFYFFGRLLPDGLVYSDPYGLRELQSASLAFALFIFIPIAISVYAIEEMSELEIRHKRLLILTVLLSSPFLYAFERGNIILYSFAFTLLFIALRNSGNRFKKEIALIALALAFAIKIYPAAFGILLLKHKQIKEAVRCAIYGIALFFLPFLGLGGLGRFSLMIRWLTQRSDVSGTEGLGAKINFANVIRIYLLKLFGISDQVSWPQIAAIVLGIILLAAGLCLQKEWMSAAAIAFAISGIPSYSYFYVAVFLLIPLILIFNEKELNSMDISGLALLLIALAPFPVTFMVPERTYSITVLQCITGSIMFILTIVIAAVLVKELISRVRSVQPLKQDRRQN